MITQQEGEAVPARGGGDGSAPATQSQWFKGDDAGRPGTIIAAGFSGFKYSRLMPG